MPLLPQLHLLAQKLEVQLFLVRAEAERFEPLELEVIDIDNSVPADLARVEDLFERRVEMFVHVYDLVAEENIDVERPTLGPRLFCILQPLVLQQVGDPLLHAVAADAPPEGHLRIGRRGKREGGAVRHVQAQDAIGRLLDSGRALAESAELLVALPSPLGQEVQVHLLHPRGHRHLALQGIPPVPTLRNHFPALRRGGAR
mmetsp:Transcript_22304/g.69401  ORF Transcript_22304/g.69401 Transcript_22304/m.69401 type:complete len:201 (-) Transcript_22304:135-737(-)